MSRITAPMPILRAMLFTVVIACTGVGILRLPAGRGVTDGVEGSSVGVSVRVGSGVDESTPVTVGVTVELGVTVKVGVSVAANGVREVVAVGVGVLA